eukprot:8912862-Heterocapsa_arctica.AAC.1
MVDCPIWHPTVSAVFHDIELIARCFLLLIVAMVAVDHRIVALLLDLPLRLCVLHLGHLEERIAFQQDQ